jgi:hypothetical protein
MSLKNAIAQYKTGFARESLERQHKAMDDIATKLGSTLADLSEIAAKIKKGEDSGRTQGGPDRATMNALIGIGDTVGQILLLVGSIKQGEAATVKAMVEAIKPQPTKQCDYKFEIVRDKAGKIVTVEAKAK